MQNLQREVARRSGLMNGASEWGQSLDLNILGSHFISGVSPRNVTKS